MGQKAREELGNELHLVLWCKPKMCCHGDDNISCSEPFYIVNPKHVVTEMTIFLHSNTVHKHNLRM